MVLLTTFRDLLLFFSWFVKKYFFVSHIRLFSKKLKLAVSVLTCEPCVSVLLLNGFCEKSSCKLEIKLDDPSEVNELNFAEFHTFLEVLSELRKFTPSSFLDCVNEFEFMMILSDNKEFRSSHRSSLEAFSASCVFRPVRDRATLYELTRFSAAESKSNW